jgi:hypothetical protein
MMAKRKAVVSRLREKLAEAQRSEDRQLSLRLEAERRALEERRAHERVVDRLLEVIRKLVTT